jgi:hypothetical protein
VAANATSAHPIAGRHVYIDGVIAWNTSNWIQCISPSVPVGVGTLNLTVRAWDSTGANTSHSETVIPMVVNMRSPTSGETAGRTCR